MSWLKHWEIDGIYGIFPCDLYTIYDIQLSVAGKFLELKQKEDILYDKSKEVQPVREPSTRVSLKQKLRDIWSCLNFSFICW